MKKQILESIRNIVKENLYIHNVELTPSSHLRNDLGLDSLDILEIIFKLEEEYNVKLPDLDEHEINLVQDVIDAFYDKISGKL